MYNSDTYSLIKKLYIDIWSLEAFLSEILFIIFLVKYMPLPFLFYGFQKDTVAPLSYVEELSIFVTFK